MTKVCQQDRTPATVGNYRDKWIRTALAVMPARTSTLGYLPQRQPILLIKHTIGFDALVLHLQLTSHSVHVAQSASIEDDGYFLNRHPPDGFSNELLEGPSTLTLFRGRRRRLESDILPAALRIRCS